MADVNNSGASSTSEEEVKDESLKASEADTETSEGEESEKLSPKAQNRFQQLATANKELRETIATLKQYAVSPEDLATLRQLKAAQKESEEAEEGGEDISPAKLKALRELIRKADPEYAKMLKAHKERETSEAAKEKEKSEAQFDLAEDIVRDFAVASLGIPKKSEEDISWFAQDVMKAVQNDEKLLRLWNTGQTESCVKKACDKVKSYYQRFRAYTPKANGDLADKRRISRLPALPSGAAGVGGKPSQGTEEKGITKKTHDEAWALIQEAARD